MVTPQKHKDFPLFLKGAPCGIHLGSHGPLHTGEGLVEAVTVKSSILTRIYKVFSISVTF